MKYYEFVATVRDRGEYPGRDEAGDLAPQLPDPLAEAVRRGRREQTGSYGVQDFCRRVAERTGAQPRTAEQDASAVLSTLADAVSGGGLTSCRPGTRRCSAGRG